MPCAIEIAIDETVEEMADIKSADPAGGVCITHDVDRAAVAQQMVKLCLISELIDPIQVDQKKPTRIFGRGPDVVKIHVFLSGNWCEHATMSRSSPTT